MSDGLESPSVSVVTGYSIFKQYFCICSFWDSFFNQSSMLNMAEIFRVKADSYSYVLCVNGRM